ncbi:amidohydrolase family protein [Amnibacterium sp. CER49]|uniref:amidohydrolase n=1 Tax=Amnibacterium sp. CER49 TaxID=3039161 RepID=UPI002446C133|nr:amidohydrolase family protein [Amnibacterium sp. CER49]MDH2442541.1 amidohydrolase family protein [Amnibacterium sp. CER49]
MPDLLLHRARLGAGLVDVRIEDGRITALAPQLDAGPLEVVEADGRRLLRGLWDEHVHMTQAALAASWIQLGGATSAAEATELVRRGAAEQPGDWPLLGIGFRDGVWPDLPTRAALDAAAGERPVVLTSHDVHAVWLSSAAGRRFGVELDDSGLLREGAAFAVARDVRELSEASADPAVAALAEQAAQRGVVGIVDFEMAWNKDPWLRRAAAGFAALRVEAAVYPFDLDRAADEGLCTGAALDDDLGLLSVGPLKTLIDGALNTRTAYLAEPYPDGTRGLLTVPPDELRALLTRAREVALTPAVHAIGDAAVKSALDAFEATGVSGRIEHAQLVADADLPRFGRLGVTASVQPGHLLDDRDVAEQHWPGRTGRAYPFRRLLDAGATLVLGSDTPVAPLDPWLAIRAAVERTGDEQPPWHGEQRITLGEALAASTRGRAEPRVGDAADLVLLDEPLERMSASGVAATLVAGRFTHRRF